jgi:hypothetical protein
MYTDFYKLEIDNIFDEYDKNYINFEVLISSISNSLKNNRNDHLSVNDRIGILLSFSNKNPFITNCDMIVKHLFNTLKYKTKYENMPNIVSDTKDLILFLYLHENSYDINSLINSIVSLTLQSYEDIVTESSNIDINSIYNETKLEAVLGYLVLLTYQTSFNPYTVILNSNNKSKLLDASLCYLYNLCNYINNQTKYFNTLVTISNKYQTFLRKINSYQRQLSLNKRILLKWSSYMNLEFTIEQIDQWRIYYNSRTLISNEHTMLQILPIDLCSKIYSISYGLIENIKNFNIDTNTETANGLYLLNSFWNCAINVLSNYDNNFCKSIEYIKNINIIIIKYSIHDLVLKTFHNLDDKNQKSVFKIKYHNFVCSLLDNLGKSIIEIAKYTKPVDTEIDFVETNKYVVHFEFMREMISELNYILDIYKCLEFDLVQLEMFSDIVFRLYCNQDFKNIIQQDRKKFTYEIGVYYFWDKYVVLLEQRRDLLISLIQKMVQSDFNYTNLDDISISRFPRKWIKLFNKYYSCKDDIIKLSDKFGDPITFEIIKEPLMLPVTKQFIDKSVIYQILNSNPINPFNGVPLTIEELEEYNTQDDVKSKIAQFMTELNNEMKKINVYKKPNI